MTTPTPEFTLGLDTAIDLLREVYDRPIDDRGGLMETLTNIGAFLEAFDADPDEDD